MSSPNGTSPLVERPATASPAPSPVHEALKGNLEAAGETNLSLRKKRSWIGSLRDVVQKGALHAKAAIDVFRSDQHTNEKPTEPTETPPADSEIEVNEEHASLPRGSMNCMTKSLVSSTTPLPFDSERRHRLISRVATTSLRQHLSSHTSRKNRGSVYSVAGRLGDGTADIAGPEQFASISLDDDNDATHTRKSSITDSIVGSIRSMSRRAGKAKPTPACTKDVSPEVPIDVDPLPSSPIDIPAAAPSLDLDLGPAGFMTPMFGRSPERNQKECAVESKKLMNSANITTGAPSPTPVLAFNQLPVQTGQHNPLRPVTPRDLLKIQFDDVGPPPPPGPATPMPGTSFALEMGGANSGKSDKSKVFERSVTPSLNKERKELRKMRSLDAMADACAIAHANDEFAEMTELPSSNTAESAVSFSQEQSLRPLTPRRNDRSSETTQTLHSCPPNMQELIRQRTPDNTRQIGIIVADATSDHSENSMYEDPFDDRNATKSGPPSPDRTVELPFRPKVYQSIENESTTDGHEDNETNINVEIVEDGAGEPDSSNDKIDQSQLQSQVGHDRPEQFPKENVDPFQTTASDDDTHIQDEQPLASDIVLPNYDNIDLAASEGLSPHGEPLIPRVYYRVNASQNTSPRSIRSRTTYTTGLGDTEYKFSFDNWLRESSSTAPPESEPSTPHCRRMDMSLDSVSTSGERKTPEASPTTTTSDHTPSMGNRLDFELKRSERNSRYNVLHQASLPVPRDAMQSSRRGPPRFILGASDETDATDIHLANFESAYANSREATPQKIGKALQSRVGSEGSVADSLKNAAYDYSQLEERLSHVPQSDDQDIFADPIIDAEFGDLPNEAFEAINISHACPSTTAETPVHPSQGEDESGINSEEDEDFRFEFKPTSSCGFTPPAQSSPFPTRPQPLAAYGMPSMPVTESPMTVTGRPGQNRVASSDTLDRSLKLFMSSESGYQADDSSVCEPNLSASKAGPTRYRSKGKRGGKPLSEISDNIS